ncbi:MAG: hypothetical protein LBS65_00005 [Desulfovibrio sp.]|nr:hypothetical protein [Desulfovibrio sp.]
MWPNVFLNPYQQPENKLTYNFLCLLSHYQPKEFIEYLLVDEKLAEKAEIQNFEAVFGGGEANPDGMFEITSGNENIRVFLEIKTFRRKLDLEQLKRHLICHCEGKGDTRLLVITSDKRDKHLIKSLCDARIRFRSWEEIAGFILKHSDDRITRDFVLYGEEQGEFEEPMDVTKHDIDVFTAYVQSKWERKITLVLNETIQLITDEDNFPIKKAELATQNAWGRNTIKIEFPYSRQNDYGQWLACGIYYDTKDHRIPFKEKGVPELAFFFDMYPVAARQLPDEIKDAFKKLISKGFEENTDGQITPNRWRVLFKRIPLSEINSLDAEYLKKFLYDCISDISKIPILANLLPRR